MFCLPCMAQTYVNIEQNSMFSIKNSNFYIHLRFVRSEFFFSRISHKKFSVGIFCWF